MNDKSSRINNLGDRLADEIVELIKKTTAKRNEMKELALAELMDIDDKLEEIHTKILGLGKYSNPKGLHDELRDATLIDIENAQTALWKKQVVSNETLAYLKESPLQRINHVAFALCLRGNDLINRVVNS